MNIHTAIVDDNNFLIDSVKEKLSFFSNISVIFTAENGRVCMEKLQESSLPSIILMDIEMPEMNGIEATAIVKKDYPEIKVIVLTVFDDDENIFNAIQAGADGYLMKDTGPQELYDALVNTMEGGAVMTPSIAYKTLNLLRSPLNIEKTDKQNFTTLTKREIEVLEKLSTGMPYTAIADSIFIAPSTVRRHIENIYKKLQVHSKVEAIDLAKRIKIID